MSCFYRGRHSTAGSQPAAAGLLTWLRLLLLLVLAVSSVLLVHTRRQSAAEEAAFRALASGLPPVPMVVPSPQADAEAVLPEEAPAEIPAETEYAPLREQNPDFSGWLNLPGTKIDYPVMAPPDDPEFYLHHAFDRTESRSGTLFVGENASIDSDCFIVYGHNMKNDTMFGTLDLYQAPSFRAEHPEFTLTTITEQRTYEVFAAVYCRILYENEQGYRYYRQAGDLSEEEYSALVDYLKSQSIYDTEITPEYGEQIILLSTCSYHTDNGRFLVAARRK